MIKLLFAVLKSLVSFSILVLSVVASARPVQVQCSLSGPTMAGDLMTPQFEVTKDPPGPPQYGSCFVISGKTNMILMLSGSTYQGPISLVLTDAGFGETQLNAPLCYAPMDKFDYEYSQATQNLLAYSHVYPDQRIAMTNAVGYQVNVEFSVSNGSLIPVRLRSTSGDVCSIAFK